MINEHTRERWKTRRLMSWLSLGGLFLLPTMILIKDKEWLMAASGIIIASITLFGSIIMVYIGFATMDDKK